MGLCNLMVKFYQALTHEGVSKSEALRQAQLEILQSPRYKDPFYWAPFVLVGNWL
ncbi:MAG: CHAT domain-containing protein [Hormoscilla sp. GUM202]|nr:CHAT domain-containing protein [Hormoscilla sp. GUM202]